MCAVGPGWQPRRDLRTPRDGAGRLLGIRRLPRLVADARRVQPFQRRGRLGVDRRQGPARPGTEARRPAVRAAGPLHQPLPPLEPALQGRLVLRRHRRQRYVGAVVVRASQWVWPHDNSIQCLVKDTGNYAGLRGGTWHGRRLWWLFAPTLAPADIGYVTRHAWEGLDKLNHEFILDWPGQTKGGFSGMNFYDGGQMNPTGGVRGAGRRAVADAGKSGDWSTLTPRAGDDAPRRLRLALRPLEPGERQLLHRLHEASPSR